MIRETLPPTLEDEGNTYEKIRHRITRLLKSPRAQEVNKNVRKLIVYNFKILRNFILKKKATLRFPYVLFVAFRNLILGGTRSSSAST